MMDSAGLLRLLTLAGSGAGAPAFISLALKTHPVRKRARAFALTNKVSGLAAEGQGLSGFQERPQPAG